MRVGCESCVVLVVRATKRLLDRVGAATPVEEASTTVLGDWYATALFWRPQVVILVNERTLLPVLVPFAPARTLGPRFVGELVAVFGELGLEPRFIDAEVGAMAEHRFAVTANRSVVGSMT